MLLRPIMISLFLLFSVYCVVFFPVQMVGEEPAFGSW